MKFIKLFILLPLLVFTQLALSQTSSTINVNGVNRNYIIHIPSNLDLSIPRPVVFNFHGFTSNGTQQRLNTGFDAVATANDFIVVYPNGVGNAWNVGWDFGSSADDIGFVNAMIDTLHARHNIDLGRVYSTGFSNGGFFSYELACNLPDRITAIASVAGSMLPERLNQCDPGRPFPIMQIHGTSDLVVSYNGSGIGTGIENLVNSWAEINECSIPGETIDVENINTSDQTTSERTDYQCGAETNVAFYKITGGGHTWPDGNFNIGAVSLDFNASEKIWEFFSQYSHPVITSTKDLYDNSIDLTLAPNPFNDFIKISSEEVMIHNVKVYNSIGQLVYNKDQSSIPSIDINTSNFGKGLFLFLVETSEGFKTIKQAMKIK